MRIYQYGTYNWEAEGYYFGLNEDVVLMPSVEPQILLRTGTYPTFGVTQVGAMSLAGEFGFREDVKNPPWKSAQLAASGGPEVAFLHLFFKLDAAYSVTPGPPRWLYAERNDGVLMTIPALLAIPNTASSKSLNNRNANFVCVQPWWINASGANLTGTGIFT
jgi:hypothetical protein